MKNKKRALGLVAMLVAVAGLSACDEVSSTNNGSIFTYTDAAGNRVSYTAEDLLSYYRKTGSSLSTEFDKVYEVMIRRYYDTTGKATKATLEAEATSEVLSIKNTAQKTAETNGTSYEAEFESQLSSAGVKNAEELYQLKLYNLEKSKFETELYNNYGTGDSTISGYEAIKNGYYTKDGSKTYIFQSDANTWGISNDGWIKEQMPYHTRHILIKFANGKTGEYTQDKIAESTGSSEGGEATNLAQVIIQLAGASYSTNVDSNNNRTTNISTASNRLSFGSIAKSMSDDSSSAAAFGDVGFMSKTTSFNNEYKLGLYTYESIYNQREKNTSWGNQNAYRITPGLTEDATSVNDVDSNQTLEDGTTINDYFNNFSYSTSESTSETGIGQIPFGAAVALLDYSKVTKDSNGNVVNEGNESYYPRNVIFNKYFNKHNVCVITPNAIWSNNDSGSSETATAANNCADVVSGDSVVKQNFVGEYTSEYGNLPGFKTDTTNILPQFQHNVLTNESGNIVLAVRTSTDSYQAIHFIVVERSALSQYGLTESNGQIVENTDDSESTGTPTLSDYYTTSNPGDSSYPTYKDGSTTKNMTTYVNYNKTTSQDYADRSGAITSDIKSYNSALNTYFFEKLVNDQSVKFNDSTLEDEMMVYSQTKRQSAKDTNFTSWKDSWKTYAEVLEAQESARSSGLSDGKGSLLTETTAVQFSDPNKDTSTGVWAKGGACYYGTK
ncbi:MAG: hypothetical protein LKJ81_02460 [Bacilli bacterium]|jgi:hypothetical protein|nr:hypothetical protein [Bacilli bacterium]MCI2055003.1 hypothetical protein [Bacilli bacterium]